MNDDATPHPQLASFYSSPLVFQILEFEFVVGKNNDSGEKFVSGSKDFPYVHISYRADSSI